MTSRAFGGVAPDCAAFGCRRSWSARFGACVSTRSRSLYIPYRDGRRGSAGQPIRRRRRLSTMPRIIHRRPPEWGDGSETSDEVWTAPGGLGTRPRYCAPSLDKWGGFSSVSGRGPQSAWASRTRRRPGNGFRDCATHNTLMSFRIRPGPESLRSVKAWTVLDWGWRARTLLRLCARALPGPEAGTMWSKDFSGIFAKPAENCCRAQKYISDEDRGAFRARMIFVFRPAVSVPL